MAPVNKSLSPFSACFQLILILPLWFLLARVDAETEVDALISFRVGNTMDPATEQTYWQTWNMTDETPCGWVGVICTPNHTVFGLDFSGWGIVVNILLPLIDLTDLCQLDLSSNSVDSPPVDLGNLTGLTWLDLSFSQMSGPFDVSALTNLRYLFLEQNLLESVPSGLRYLVNLQFLSLADNSLTGPFPIEDLGDLSSLVSLDLSSNLFHGPIPSLPNLTHLVELKLDGNNFTGFEVPWILGAMRLLHLSVSNNQLEGTIPSNITGLSGLLVLNMSGNSLSGEIPSGFSVQNSNPGFSLDLSQNNLSGKIPADILQQAVFHQEACASVNVSHNRLTGRLPIPEPVTVCFLTVDLSHNNLSGPISSLILSSVVSHLWLQNNSFFGDLVDALLSATRIDISDLRLQNNLLTGDLSRIATANFSIFPDATANFSIFPGDRLAVNIFDVTNNHLGWSVSDAIPDPVQATLEALTTYCPNLLVFRVGGNNFSGTSFPSACGVNAIHNGLEVLDLSNSQLKGEILGAAFNNTCLPSIQLLNLSNNIGATGPLLESIIAHDQQDFIVDVSNNNLSGPLPTILPSSNLYNPRYFLGNGGLCGAPLSACLNDVDLPQQEIGASVHWWELLVIIGGSVAIAMGSCLVATWRWKVYQKRHQQDEDLIKTLLERESVTLMSLRDLKKATNNFCQSAQIGEGGFGIVYTGKLNDGTIVAIKRSKQEGAHKDKEQFLNEVRILSQVNHRHLVKLLGCSMENKTAVLVFEFVSNGTLKDRLQGRIGAVHLSWKQRLNIAIQTADALNYLHSGAPSPIFHRDVKSANILLDNNLNAKVADFGISKLVPLQATHVSTIAIQGTIGYIDPEYYTSYQLTDKSDVYSFCVVLLELISGKPALDFSRGEDEASLVNWACPYIESGDLAHFVDPLLMETYNDQTGCGKESILNVGRVAMKCLKMNSKSRPSMKEVLKELQNFWIEFVGTSKHLDCINEEDDEYLQGDSITLLSIKSLFQGGSSLLIQKDVDNGIEMPQFSS